jgi:hypothetical protein
VVKRFSGSRLKKGLYLKLGMKKGLQGKILFFFFYPNLLSIAYILIDNLGNLRIS